MKEGLKVYMEVRHFSRFDEWNYIFATDLKWEDTYSGVSG